MPAPRPSSVLRPSSRTAFAAAATDATTAATTAATDDGDALDAVDVAATSNSSNARGERTLTGTVAVIRRLWAFVRFPAPYDGPILSGRIDGLAYLAGWIATFVHLTLLVCVFALGLNKPWPTVSTISSFAGTLLFVTIVIVIHRRLGQRRSLPLNVAWQWWLGPWDSVGRLVWLPVRLPEAARVLMKGAPAPGPDTHA